MTRTKTICKLFASASHELKTFIFEVATTGGSQSEEPALTMMATKSLSTETPGLKAMDSPSTRLCKSYVHQCASMCINLNIYIYTHYIYILVYTYCFICILQQLCILYIYNLIFKLISHLCLHLPQPAKYLWKCVKAPGIQQLLSIYPLAV